MAVYFEHVHPMYPFLDLQTWEVTVSMPDFHQTLAQNRPWHCLYYTVLALGCQYAHGGSFEPGKGEAWSLFSLALAGFSDLLLLPDSLVTLQALTAMAVYGLGINALAIEHVIMSEATRRAQSMSKIHLSGQSANVYRKTFWMLYCLEKVTSFHFGRSSVGAALNLVGNCQLITPRALSMATYRVQFPQFLRLPALGSIGFCHSSATPG